MPLKLKASKKPAANQDELIDRVKRVGGIMFGASEGRNWIELFYEGDLMHSKTVDLPPDRLFEIFVEEIPHKSTIYEHPRTMIYFDRACTLEIYRDGSKIVISGCETEGKKVKRVRGKRQR